MKKTKEAEKFCKTLFRMVNEKMYSDSQEIEMRIKKNKDKAGGLILQALEKMNRFKKLELSGEIVLIVHELFSISEKVRKWAEEEGYWRGVSDAENELVYLHNEPKE